MTKDYYLAQDICQETFLRLYVSREQIEKGREKYWLKTVAENLGRDFLRKGGKYRELLEEAPQRPKERDYIEIYLEHLSRQELRLRVLEGLYRKNRNWYEVFVWVEYLELPRKQIAGAKGIALSTVDAYLYKGRKWMAEHYRKAYEEL